MSIMRDHRKPEIAFVLSGGASLGAAQVGMLRALLERGIRPDLIVGTSIGSWNGLWLAAHPDLASLDTLERVWKRITLVDVLGTNVVNVVANLATRRPYLVTDEGMRRLFQRSLVEGEIVDVTFEQLQVPFIVTATNLMQGRSESFKSGPVTPPVIASSAIPGLFPPVMIDGQQYVDGGLLDNAGVHVAVEAGARVIYILSMAHAGSLTKPVTTLPELFDRSLHLITARHVGEAIERYAGLAEFIVIEDEHVLHLSSLDFTHATELFASGYRAAQRALAHHDAELAVRALAVNPVAAVIPSPLSMSLWSKPLAKRALREVARLDLAVQHGWRSLSTFMPKSLQIQPAALTHLPHRQSKSSQ